MSSEDAVRRVLAGEKVDPKSKASTSSSRSQDKENREGRERQPDREVCSTTPSTPFLFIYLCTCNGMYVLQRDFICIVNGSVVN